MINQVMGILLTSIKSKYPLRFISRDPNPATAATRDYVTGLAVCFSGQYDVDADWLQFSRSQTRAVHAYDQSFVLVTWQS